MSEATETTTPVEEAAETTIADGDTTTETKETTIADGETKETTEESTETAETIETGPPEKYEITAPEGVELDQELLDMATPIMREEGLTNQQAQKMFDLQLQVQAKQDERLKTMEVEAHAEAKKTWGDDYKPMSQRVNALLNKFDEDKALRRETIGPYGLRDNPHLLTFLDRIAKAIGEDSTDGVPGGGGKHEPTVAERLYGGTGQRDVSDVK